MSGFGVISGLLGSGSSIVETAVVSLVLVAVSLGSVEVKRPVRSKLVSAIARIPGVTPSRGVDDKRSRSDSGRGFSSVRHGLSDALVASIS
jgi:hypothetical protein